MTLLINSTSRIAHWSRITDWIKPICLSVWPSPEIISSTDNCFLYFLFFVFLFFFLFLQINFLKSLLQLEKCTRNQGSIVVWQMDGDDSWTLLSYKYVPNRHENKYTANKQSALIAQGETAVQHKPILSRLQLGIKLRTHGMDCQSSTLPPD